MSAIPLMLLIIFHFLSIQSIATNSSAILYEIPTLVTVYKNGTVQRLSGTETVPPSLDQRLGVMSKDIYIDPKLNISARLYLPKTATRSRKLPLLVYFHGGAFITNSAFSPMYHSHLNSLVAEANVVAVSVNYRLAPEHPLPIGYEDSWLALKWVFSHCKNNGTETWLKNYADFEHVYLGGDSAGANIAHNTAVWAGLEKLDDKFKLQGVFLNCPFFWGKKSIGNESSNPMMVARTDSILIHAYPNSTNGLDNPLLNPAMCPNISKLRCNKVLVYVAENDFLRDRGLYYVKAVRKSEWDGALKVVEVKGEGHIFNILSPNTPKAKRMLKQLALFLNSEGKLQ